ncbi:MAG: crossover junction endodeoxyribonuclease RuvC [Elusimicrobia bacterium]|nr:crossover junction endodeoxyribonuclease RuvC [Elusimicrobiota bacterium]
MIVLGVDPGIASCGWAVIEAIKDSRLTIKECGVIKTLPDVPFGNRLYIISRELKKIIRNNKPEVASVEQIYFAKNVKTAITVSHARGVVIVTCVEMGLSICEFTPLQVKQALTGYGQADKNQVGYMVKNILKLKELPKDDNTVDAIAIGICYLNTNSVTQIKANITNKTQITA